MKKIALIAVLAAALIYFLVSRNKNAARVREEAILNSIPQNAFEGPTVDGSLSTRGMSSATARVLTREPGSTGGMIY